MSVSSPTSGDSQRISITICGDGGCGKSSITLRLVRSQWTQEYDPTIEDSYSVTRTVDGAPAFLSLTDTAGQEEYRGLISSYSLASDAFLLVYDITNPATLYEQLPYFLDLVQQERDTRAEGILSPGRDADNQFATVEPIVLVAGNKCDLKEQRAITSSEGLRWAREHGCGFMETSARECVNVEETFALIVRRVREAREQHLYRQNGGAPPGSNDRAGFAAAAVLQQQGSGPYGQQVYGGHEATESSVNEKGGFFGPDHSKNPLKAAFWKSGRWWRWAKCW